MKLGNDLTQQNNIDTDDTTTSTYELDIPSPQCFKNKNVNAFYAEILDAF